MAYIVTHRKLTLGRILQDLEKWTAAEIIGIAAALNQHIFSSLSNNTIQECLGKVFIAPEPLVAEDKLIQELRWHVSTCLGMEMHSMGAMVREALNLRPINEDTALGDLCTSTKVLTAH